MTKTPQLSAALVKVHEKLVNVEKDKKGRFPYASLEGILAKVKPVLAEHGLCIKQIPGFFAHNDGGRVSLNTTVVHTSGEYEEYPVFDMPIEPRHSNSIQQNIGTAITYARRYQLCAILNIGQGSVDPDEFDEFESEKISSNDLLKVKKQIQENEMPENIILKQFQVPSLEDLKTDQMAAVFNAIKKYCDRNRKPYRQSK